jgi:hypothetical protein
MWLGSDYLTGIQGPLEIPLVLDLYYLSFRLFLFLITSLLTIHQPYFAGGHGFLNSFKRTLPAVLYEPVDTTARKLCKGNFSLSVKGFVQGILSNVFHKSDFVTNFAKTDMMFILTPSIVVCLSMGI